MTIDVGDRAPDFTLPNQLGKEISLSDFAGSRLLLYFYPKAATPGCTTQACDLRDRHDRFAAAGWAILGVSPDPPERLAPFHFEHGLPFPLLSDPDHAVAADYGAWGTKRNYGREYEGLIRSTFVIDPSGVIQLAKRNVKATGHGDRMLRQIDSG